MSSFVMESPAGVDEFGREHFSVEAPCGRLGVSLGENESGYVVIRGIDVLAQSEMEVWSEIDRRRVQLMRQSVQVGDRIVAIEGEDVVHCSLKEIICRLGKLSAVTRRLTFARYHETGFNTKQYDVEKLVIIRVPSGPLGLLINECIPYGAFVEDFQRLPDGAMSKLASHPKIHRGCQVISVNSVDVSSSSRDEVIALLGSLKDKEKDVVFYCATSSTCTSIYSVESSVSERHLGFTIDENEISRCVIKSVGPRGHPNIGLGDVLIGVNSTDITTMHRKDAITLVKDTPLPRQLYFARRVDVDLPECHLVKIGPGTLGVNLDGEQRDFARITGFTTPQDAERPEFKVCARFVPGSFFIAVNSFSVAGHTLAATSALLAKLRETSKEIILGNKAMLDICKKKTAHAKIQVPPGALGINFAGGRPDAAVVAGFYRTASGAPGLVESSEKIPVGATLQRVDAMNISCLPLTQTTAILKKLADVPKEMVFHLGTTEQDINTSVVDVRVPPGPLGIDLKCSMTNKVIVDNLNEDPSKGSTRVYDHGGVVQGSELVAIDGFDVSTMELVEVLQLLKSLVIHEKVITFSTTSAAYSRMLEPLTTPGLVEVDLLRNTTLSIDEGILDQAVLVADLPGQIKVPLGSRLIAVDRVDLRCLSLQQILVTLKAFSGAEQISLIFDTRSSLAKSPSKAWVTQSVSAVLLSDPQSATESMAFTEHNRGSVSQVHLQNVEKPNSITTVRTSMSTPELSSTATVPSPSQATTTSMALSVGGGAVQVSSASLDACPASSSSSLARLSIRTMEATRPGSDDISKVETAKTQQQMPSPATSLAPKNEFLINMSSWMGSRSLYRLVLDTAANTIQITPVKATSPRPGKPSGSSTISFADIVAMDCGASSPGDASQRRSSATPSLLRSPSASLNADGSERATVVLLTTSKKSVEFDMRSTDERGVFASRMRSLVPAFAATSD